MNRSLSVAIILAATPLFAQCPSGPLGPEGLKLTRYNPFMELVYQPSPEGVVELRKQDRGGFTQTRTSVYPHPLMVGKQISENGELVLQYDRPVSDLHRLDKTKVWDANAKLLIGGKVVDQGVAHAQFKAIEKISIGTCVYKVWVVEDYINLTETGKTAFAHFYSPDLGVVLQALALDENSRPVSIVAFDKIERP